MYFRSHSRDDRRGQRNYGDENERHAAARGGRDYRDHRDPRDHKSSRGKKEEIVISSDEDGSVKQGNCRVCDLFSRIYKKCN